ncbi:MAG: hypothetical protein ABIH92_01090, partial [Nanoarchaeota archaeon]
MKKEAVLLAVALVVLLMTEVSANTAPLIGETDGEILICEASTLSYRFNATDIDGSTLIGGISPSGPFYVKRISSDPPITQMELFSDNLTKEQSNKVYKETLFVSDGQLVDVREINITILETNNPPGIKPLGVETILLNQSHDLDKQVFVEDIESGNQDNGRLSFSIRDASGYSELDINNLGIINFSHKSSNPGLHEIEVCVTDSGIKNVNQKIGFCGRGDLKETSCETFQLALVDKNIAPTILLYNSTNRSNEIMDIEEISFEIFKFDPEGLIPDTYWYVNGMLKQFNSGSSSDKFVYSFGCEASGRHTIKAEITDGLLNDSIKWNFKVLKTDCPEGIVPRERIGDQTCEENWGCNSWNLCQSAVQSRIESGVLSSEDYEEIRVVCSENDWSEDVCGFQIRTCSDTNECNTIDDKPIEITPCYFSLDPSCSDGIKNCHDSKCEFLADCGGPCLPCPTCSDGTKNQGEESADCGGPCFGECPAKAISDEEKSLKQKIMIVTLLLIFMAVIQARRVMKTKKKLEIPSRKQIRTNTAGAFILFLMFVLLFSFPGVKAEVDCFP